MPQLDSGPGSAGTPLELCWKAAVPAGVGAAGSHELAVKRRQLVHLCWLSSETKSRKLERWACVDIGYEGKQDCWIERRQRTV